MSRRQPSSRSCRRRRFNDAAAVHRGCLGVPHDIQRPVHASMMPRLFTADVGRCGPREVAGVPASMMPRLFTADVGRSALPFHSQRGPASMMPRLFTADVSPHPTPTRDRQRASMMPRLFTADVHLGGRATKHPLGASMMPRLFTADVSPSRVPHPACLPGTRCERWRNSRGQYNGIGAAACADPGIFLIVKELTRRERS